jgi:hypothetical protein
MNRNKSTALSPVLIKHILQETSPWFQLRTITNITLLLNIIFTQFLFSPETFTVIFQTISTYPVSSQPKLPENYNTSKATVGNNTKTHKTHAPTLSLALTKADTSPPALFISKTSFGDTQQSSTTEVYQKNTIESKEINKPDDPIAHTLNQLTMSSIPGLALIGL